MVNYCTPNHVCRSIECLTQERNKGWDLRLRIVDNKSPDSSLELMRNFVSSKNLEWVEIIAAEHNGGYAYGNNLALQNVLAEQAEVDYIWFLNPDTEPRPGAAAALIEFLQKNPRTIVGSRLEDDDGTPQISHFNFPGLVSEFLSTAKLGILDRLFESKRVVRRLVDEAVPSDWLAGASFMMTSDVLKELGPMDQAYFLYFEEVDYLLAANNKGVQCWYVPSSRVVHAVGASTGISDSRRKVGRKPKYWFDSRRRFFIKNYGALGLVCADLAHFFGYSSWYLRSRLLKPRVLENQPPRYIRDFVANSFIMRGFKL